MQKQSMDSLEMVRLCRELALEKKAEEVVMLDMRGISSFCDFFLICSGSSEPHLKAIASNIEMRLKEQGHMPRGREGVYSSHWVIIDFNDVIIHVFRSEARQHYALERLWGDAKHIVAP